MVVQWIEDAAGFDALHEEWNGLLAHSAADTIFLTWEWLRTWWKHLPTSRRLRIATLRDDGELMAIAPLMVRPPSWRRLLPFRALAFLGTGTVGSDYLDLIVRSGAESDAAGEFCDALNGCGEMLEFGQLRSGAQAARLAAALDRDGWMAARRQVNVCPFIDTRNLTWTTYLAALGSEHRYNVQRKIRNLEKKFAVEWERVAEESQRSAALDTLIALHNKRWSTGEKGDSDAFHTPGHVRFHQEFTALALQRGWLRLYLLRLDGQPAAAFYGLKYGRTFSFYQSGFDPEYARHSVGLVTMALAIKSAIEEGAEEYDLLHGGEAYKFHWAKETRELWRLDLYPPGVYGAAMQAVADARQSVGQALACLQGSALRCLPPPQL